MSCCSSQRRASSSSPMLRAAVAVAQPRAAESTVVTLHYSGKTPLLLRGPFSGCVYRVGQSQKAVIVDPRDVEAMLRTGLFALSAG